MKPLLLDLPMPIETPRLILRPPVIGDGQMLNEVVVGSFEQLRQFMPWARIQPTLAETEEFIRMAAANWILKKNEEPYLPLLILDKKTKLILGATGLHHFDWEVPSFECGYWLKNSATNQGFMTEAVNALTRYVFLQLKAKRLVVTCDENNIRSKKVPERLGFVLEATLKSHRKDPNTNEIRDTLLFAKYDLSNIPDLEVKW